MKTKSLFFMSSMFILTVLCNVNAQSDNIIVTTPVLTAPARDNVLIGSASGANTNPNATPSSAEENTFVGSHSGNAHTIGTRNAFFGAFSGASLSGFFADNTFIGARSGRNVLTGNSNTYIGAGAGMNNINGTENTFIGVSSGLDSTGSNNFFLGSFAGRFNRASGNLFVGTAAGHGSAALTSTGIRNTFMGHQSGTNFTSGGFNTYLGWQTGFSNTTGNSNVFIGESSGVFNIAGSSNVYVGRGTGISNQGSGNVFLGSGVGSAQTNVSDQLYIDNMNTNTPLIMGDFNLENLTFNVDQSANSRVIINSGTNNASFNGTSGLRFANMNNTTNAIANPTNRVLSVNNVGDVILVTDQMGTGGGSTLVNSCASPFFVTKTNPTGNLMCSQIYDDWSGSPFTLAGSCVYMGWQSAGQVPNSAFNTTIAPYPASQLNLPPTGRFKLQVNGNEKVNGIWLTSDSNYKIDVNPLDKPLDRVLALKGVHYYWDVPNNPEMNFDTGVHTGFIAQDVENVIPHLVIDQDMVDSNGQKITRKSVNYIEIIPYLVEAIKEQQIQINDLKDQLICLNDITGCNSTEMKVAIEAANFENTRILSFSPNPSKDKVNVLFNIEEKVNSASLQLFDMNGNALSSFNIKDRGNKLSRTFEKNNYGTGIYIVSLIVNGKSLDSKKIIFE